jgi:hypothetical protein
MNRHFVAITTRRQLGAGAGARVVAAHMSQRAELSGLGGANPGPGRGGASP